MSFDRATQKVLYAHDGPLLTVDDQTFYGVHINDSIRQRYLLLGDSVTFLMRVKKRSEIEIQNYARLSDQNFSVIAVPDFKSISKYFRNKGKAKAIVEEAVREHAMVIARLPSAIGSMAVYAAHQQGKPLLVEYVACTFDAYWNYNWKGKLIAYFKLWEQQRIMRSVSYVIYVTNQFLQSRYPSFGRQIACSDVELQPLDERILSQRLEDINGHDENEPLLLVTLAAVDVPYKGQQDVVKAIYRLKKRSILFKYKIVGKGDSTKLKALVEKLDVADLVEIVGPLTHENVFELLRECDVYIQPSKQEGLPRAVVEAMSMACPVLGSRLAGIPELISENMTFQPGSVKEIQEKLAGLSKEMLIEQARINFDEARKYQRHILKKRRTDFYARFLADHNLRIQVR